MSGADNSLNLSTFSLVAKKALGDFGTSLVDYTIGEKERETQRKGAELSDEFGVC